MRCLETLRHFKSDGAIRETIHTLFARTLVAISKGLLKDVTMSVKRRMEILANCAMFQGLPPEALADLAFHALERKFAQGQILFTANTPADGFYIVLSGSIRAFRVNLDGREQRSFHCSDSAIHTFTTIKYTTHFERLKRI